MEIYINGTRIDYTLENEKTVFDITASLQDNIKKDRGVITSINIGEHSYSAGGEELKKMKIEDVQALKIEISSREEIITQTLSECKKVLAKISADIKENEFTHVKEIRELLAWITEAVDTLNSISSFPIIEARLLISTVNRIDGYLESSEQDKSKPGPLSEIISSLVTYIEAIQLKFASDYSVSFDSLSKSIDESLELLPEISEAFQIGRDREALGKINRIISVLELCGVYLRKNFDSFSQEEKDKIESLYNEINSLLGKIAGAFENGDIVLLGDLLEYELPGKLMEYKDLILNKSGK